MADGFPLRCLAATIVTPDTILRWHRKLIAAPHKEARGLAADNTSCQKTAWP